MHYPKRPPLYRQLSVREGNHFTKLTVLRCRRRSRSPNWSRFGCSEFRAAKFSSSCKFFIQAELESPAVSRADTVAGTGQGGGVKRVLVQQQTRPHLGRVDIYCEHQGKIYIQQQNRLYSDRSSRKVSVDLLKRLFTSAFLPTNYPHSVTASYAPYAFWHFLHNTLTACNSVLGTTALLVSAGVVADPNRAVLPTAPTSETLNALPTAASAATSWILKDGVGHLVRLAFGSRYAHRFDGDLKRLRVLADVLWHLGTGLELVSRSFPAAFIGLASGAYALKGMAHVVFNSTRSTIYRTVATLSNIGDVTAKGDAQSIAAELLGMAIGLVLFQSVAKQSVMTTWAIFSVVVAGQMFSRIRSMRVLVLPILNLQRAVLLVDSYVRERIDVLHSMRLHESGGWSKARAAAATNGDASDKHPTVLSPEQVAQMEYFLHWRNHWSTVPELALDVRMSWFTDSPTELASLLDVCRAEQFVVGRCLQSGHPRESQRVGLVMKRGANASDVLRGLIAAIFLVRQPSATVSDALLFASIYETEAFFAEASRCGWQLDVVHGLGNRNLLL
ncbi:hypothetical protein F1559_004989 [Cyanidiococcus yangmingshanensis]|uniref:Protein root UVB sensitive/RUS domain-containing protein n=1 Tax=Cyanidiococcus yangmingshanensis TaxID=2690220 RepID=A0A7J7IPH7_9RHOD|nr:hypothetical protein F1559_004989 [Cyanidiococcus yangmingshanensis]